MRLREHVRPDDQGLWRDVASRLEGPVPVSSFGLSSLCPVPLGQDSHSEAADPMNIGKVWSHYDLYSSDLLGFRRLSCTHCVPLFPVRLTAVFLGHDLPTLGLGRLAHVPPPGFTVCTGPFCQPAATLTATDDHQSETYEVILPECYGANLKGCLTHHHLRVDDLAAAALHSLSVFFCGLARSLLGILGLSLAGLLVHQLPGKHAPMGRLCRLPFRGTYPPSCRSLGSIGDPRSSALDWQPWVDRMGRLPRRSSPLGASWGGGKRFLFLALGISCCPLQVWAAPKELLESVQALQGTLARIPEDLPECTAAPARSHSPPEPGHARFGHASADDGEPVSGPVMQGIPTPHAGIGMPCAEDFARVPFTAYVVSPFYQPEVVECDIQLPCEEADAVRTIRRHLQHLALEFSDSLVPAYPQPCEACQTFAVHPEWATFGGLTVVVLDLRLSPLGGDGPIVAVYVTRPTNLAELNREAGMYSIRNCHVYVSSCETPLAADELVYLDHGALVRYVPVDQAPGEVRRLHHRLQDFDTWQFEQAAPHILRAGSVMLMHPRGRFIFSRNSTPGSPLDAAAADFVGIARGSVSFRVPEDGCLQRPAHRGSNLRAVFALADKRLTDQGHLVVFLDLRQIAAAPQYVLLPGSEISYEQLEGILPRPPPVGWRIAVRGGQRRSHGIILQDGETLLIGFLHVNELLSDFGSDTSSGREADEGEESEEDPDDDPDSDTSTRSRSQRGRAKQGQQEPSSDHSYEPGPAADIEKRVSSLPLFQAWPIPDEVCQALGEGQPWALFEDLPSLVKDAGDCTALSYIGCKLIEHRVPDPPSGPTDRTASGDRATEAQRFAEWPEGDGRVPDRGGPVFQVDRPGEAPQLTLPPEAEVTFLIYVFEYVPEVVRVSLAFPSDFDRAIAAAQQGRGELARARFPHLTPVHPQPTEEFGVLIATAEWMRDQYVFINLLGLNGTAFSAHISPAVDLASILAVAGIDPQLDVLVFVQDLPQPIQREDVVQMRTGYCITIVHRQQPRPRHNLLAVMLLSPLGWRDQVAAPVAPGEWLYVLTDAEPTRFLLNRDRRAFLRQDIADMLACDVDALSLKASAPRLGDHLDYGVAARAVLVATTILARAPGQEDDRTVYILDLRPISAGITWGLAQHGRVRAEPIVRRWDRMCPNVFRSQLTGGRPTHTDEGLHTVVREGEVLWIDYVPHDFESSGTDNSQDSPSSSSSSSDQSGPSDETKEALVADEANPGQAGTSAPGGCTTYDEHSQDNRAPVEKSSGSHAVHSPQCWGSPRC